MGILRLLISLILTVCCFSNFCEAVYLDGQAGKGPFVIQKDDNKRKYKEEEILVKFKSGIFEDSKANLHRRTGSKKIKEFPSLRIHHIKLEKDVGVEDAIRQYQADPSVEYAEPDYIVTSMNAPNDPFFSSLWGLHNTGQTGGTSGADIKAPEAWDITTGSNDVVVAILDTGVDYTHPDLAANIWLNPGETGGNGVDDDGNGYIDDLHGIDTHSHNSDPMDDNGHGTHVAGIMGAAGNNSIGVVGVNWQVKIMACKFLDAAGSGYTDGAIECLQYVKAMKDKGTNIVATNNSWGCSGGCYSQALYDTIDSQREILFIAAAGNDDGDDDQYPFYPANYNLPNVISVAATDQNDSKAYFSNFGKWSVHVGAPGRNIFSTIQGAYGQLSGTSMAAPYVTGLAALLKSQSPGRDWRGIRNLILSGGDNVSSLDGMTITGKRINAYGSLTCSNKPVFSVLSPPASITIGVPVALSALSINCASPVGTVTVKTAAGDTITLHDDGIAPDLVAGDGIFTGAWTPTRVSERLDFTFSSSFGTKTETVFTPPLSVDFEILNCNLGQVYSHFLKGKGGLPPYAWSITSGRLPPGITLNASTGELFGTASSPGVFTFTVKATEAFTNSATKKFSLRVIEDSIPEQWRAVHDTGATTSISGSMDIAVDASNNIYVAGPSLLDAYPYTHVVTVKYDSSGNVLWEKPYIGGDNDWVSDITVDGNGNVYSVGSADTLVADWGWRAHLAVVKYDSSGNIIWTKIDFVGDGCAYGVAVDKNGYVYVAGASHCGSWGEYRIVKYDPSGNIIWTGTYGDASHNDVPEGGIAIDGNGNIVVSGYSYDNSFNFTHLIVKFDPSGNLVWANNSDPGYWFQIGHGIAADRFGNIYVIRQSYGNPEWYTLIMKFDPSGSLLWSVPYYGYSGTGIAVDESDNIYVIGDGYILDQSTQKYRQYYVTIKYDPAGNVIWTKTSDGGPGNLSFGIALDGKGSVYVTGLSGSNLDWLTIKYNDLGIVTSALPVGAIGESYSYFSIASGGKAPYTWQIISGSLPDGLILNSSGTISGIPTVAGTFYLTVKVTDANSSIVIKQFSFSIAGLTCSNYPISVDTKPDITYDVLQDAYIAAASNNDFIMLQAVKLTGELSMDAEKIITLKGGYDCSFGGNPWKSVIQGMITISKGQLVIENVVLE